ncbi:hypothetical protein [Shinella pollutisoli]|uniref:Uncharacterized protein n=1 Tax=Shinella pollutisoli TaxID=2250594 RepID=A0ABV7DFL1_9HYPH|nr:hypothetical protein [Shinella pollutisoli]
MRTLITLVVATVAGLSTASMAYAACTGSNGRGWGSGKGNGAFQMTAADKVCRISFPGFINDAAKTRIPATDVTVTKRPKNGKVAVVAGKGILYTPNPGYKGKDAFCTRNKSSKVKGQTLSGCVTITVR